MASSTTCNRFVSRAYEDVYFPEKCLAIPFKWEACPGTPINHHQNATIVVQAHHYESDELDDGQEDAHDDDLDDDNGYDVEDGAHDDDDDDDVVANGDANEDLSHGASTIYPLPPPPRLSSFSSPCLSPLFHQGKSSGFDEIVHGFHEDEEDNIPPLPSPPVVKFHSFRANVIPLSLGLFHTSRATLQERSRSFNHTLTNNKPKRAHHFTLSPAFATWRHLASSPSHQATKLKLKDFLQTKEPLLNARLELVPTSNKCTSGLQLFVVSKRSLYNDNDNNHASEVANISEYPSSHPTKLVEPHHDDYGLVLASSTEAFYCEELTIEPKPMPMPKPPSRSFSGKLKLFLFNECTMCWNPKKHRNFTIR